MDTSENVFTVTENDVSLPKRRIDAHKGDFGRVLIIAGSTCFTGAPSFASRAAVRSGAGLVHLGVPEAIYQIEAVKNDEAMVFPLPCDGDGRITTASVKKILSMLEKSTVCLIGPGLGLSRDVFDTVYEVIGSSRVPVLVDADGITAVSRNIDVLDRASCPVILTPHEGEFLRLGGELSRLGRVDAARDFAVKHNAVLVLKGHETVSAFPDGSVYVNTTGNPGMAKGGSGDVLAGMTAALIAQLPDLKKAVTAAVYLHGKAGDVCCEKFGEYAMTPSDVIDAISDVTR